jgi:hypothetical protein
MVSWFQEMSGKFIRKASELRRIETGGTVGQTDEEIIDAFTLLLFTYSPSLKS